MLFDPPAQPQRYSDDVEEIEKDEAKTAEGLTETMLSIAEKTYEDGGHALRSVHAKSHALLKARLDVPEGLPEVLAQGLFATPGSYDAVMRFSTIPGDILDDSVSTPRGLAVKIIGVEGERAPGSKEDGTQDFVLVNGKKFNAPNAKVFLANLKMLAATTDKAEGLKKVVSAAMRGLESIVEAAGGQSALITALGGQLETHPLGESYFSQVPIRYGAYIAKVQVTPASPELQELVKAPLNVNGKPDGIREAMLEFFQQNGGVWDIRVQLCTNIRDMPVENAAKEWDEAESPFIAVGRLTVEPQQAWSEARSTGVDDGMGFSPWHALAAHRPLGSVMRMRRMAYDRSHAFRSERNTCPVHEPTSAAEVEAAA